MCTIIITKILFSCTAAIIGPVAVGIIVIGNSGVIIGLWIAHFLWTYHCVARYVCFPCIIELDIYSAFLV